MCTKWALYVCVLCVLCMYVYNVYYEYMYTTCTMNVCILRVLCVYVYCVYHVCMFTMCVCVLCVPCMYVCVLHVPCMYVYNVYYACMCTMCIMNVCIQCVLCVYVYYVYRVCMCTMYVWSPWRSESTLALLTWKYRSLWYATWLFGTKLGSSARAESALGCSGNAWAPPPYFLRQSLLLTPGTLKLGWAGWQVSPSKSVFTCLVLRLPESVTTPDFVCDCKEPNLGAHACFPCSCVVFHSCFSSPYLIIMGKYWRSLDIAYLPHRCARGTEDHC